MTVGAIGSWDGVAAQSLNRPAPTIVDNIETNDLETHLLECYLFVDDYLQSNPKVAGWRRSIGGDPDFTDAEVIAGALTGGHFRTDTLKRTYQLVIANAEGAFPDRAGYKQWIRRLQRLPNQVGGGGGGAGNQPPCAGSPVRAGRSTRPTRCRFRCASRHDMAEFACLLRTAGSSASLPRADGFTGSRSTRLSSGRPSPRADPDSDHRDAPSE